MTREEEVRLVQKYLEEPFARFERKNKQYAGGGDMSVFANFYSASHLTGHSPAEMALLYMTKHLERLYQIGSGKGSPTSGAEIRELVGDAMTYLALFAAMKELEA